jgi:hypothetical protein
VSVLGAFALFEAYIRMSQSSMLVLDDELGWVLNTRRGVAERTNHCGERARLEPPPSPHLVRDPGMCPAGRTLVLFVGDSMTQAPQVSTGSAYYDVFARHAGDRYCVFAAGVGGYGTLQESLVLERFVAERRAPDLVLWQTTPNDVINNVYDLERGDPQDNNMMRRPYLDLATDEVRFEDPVYWPFGPLTRASPAFRALFVRVVSIAHQRRYDWFARLARAQAIPESERPARIEDSFRVVERVVARARARTPGAVIIGFAGLGLEDRFATAFENAGASYLRGLMAEVERHEAIDCRPLDSHWNRHGHDVLGQLLLSRLLAGQGGAGFR